MTSLVLWVLGALLAGTSLTLAYIAEDRIKDDRKGKILTKVLSSMLGAGIGLFLLGFFV